MTSKGSSKRTQPKASASWFTGEETRGNMKDDKNLIISKRLSWILRHSATTEGILIGDDGFVNVDDLLKHPSFSGITSQDIQNVVESNDKQRYTLRRNDIGKLQIRANQGHSMEISKLELKEIIDDSTYKDVIHGTYYENWKSIKKSGLSKMKRTHIHFAPGLPGENGVISGMRSSAQILIYIDLKKAMSDGLQFYLTSNNVILCPGDKDGIIDPKYFLRVINRENGGNMLEET